jgi:broad specificity phosphatase PhoE
MDGPVGPPGQQRAGTHDPASVTAWYIRHGHNPANLPPRRLTHKLIDHPLTDRGVTQATTLAERLTRYPEPAAIYTSSLRRATQTADIIARRIGIAVTVLEDLRELNVGDLDGRSDEQAWAIHDQVLADWHAGHHDSAFPGGENYHQMTARLAAALRRTAEHAPGSRVLIIAHCGIIRAAIPAICPGTPMPATDLHNCEIAELQLRPATNGNGITATLTQWPLVLSEDSN